MKIPLHPVRFPYHFWRRFVVHPLCWALFFLSAAFNVVRVDVMDQQVIYFGQSYQFNWYTLAPIPLGFYALVLLIAAATLFGGRLFCGWACPHNILTESTRVFRGVLGIEPLPSPVAVWLKRNPTWRWPVRVAVVVLGVMLCWGLSVLLLHYLVDWPVLLGHPHPAAILGQGLLTLIGLFALLVGHLFCQSACPYGMAQSAMAYVQGKRSPMQIVYGADLSHSACGTCNGCLSTCPVDIDPRSVDKVGAFKGCWNCGECIDACATVQHYHNGTPLLSFQRVEQQP